VDVAVDEPGHDRRAGELDDAIRVRRVAGPDALHVTTVDQQPLPRRSSGERPDV